MEILKKVLYAVDKSMGGSLQEVWFSFSEKAFRRGFGFGFELFTLWGQQSPLSDLADRAGTDIRRPRPRRLCPLAQAQFHRLLWLNFWTFPNLCFSSVRGRDWILKARDSGGVGRARESRGFTLHVEGLFP